eukprot:scaffold41964_cov61-Attheya_sp.AAC.3
MGTTTSKDDVVNDIAPPDSEVNAKIKDPSLIGVVTDLEDSKVTGLVVLAGSNGSGLTGSTGELTKDSPRSSPPRSKPSLPGFTHTIVACPRSHDSDVMVNLAMADLMAYLQVVANNTSNLPHTRRDDPEVGRTVSTLTVKEYARTSAAFIPSDARIICGSFTRYGRVWDLPRSEEINPADGAQEPGRSYGGACCNSLLKVLYDAESEEIPADQGQLMNTNSLFDEDEDESAPKPFGSLVKGDVTPNKATVTWANLIQKMSEEMQQIGYAQLPTITSSRKFDLNDAFSLIPDNFDPKINKKRSLLIGCNYGDVHSAQLKASHDDIRSIKDYIINVHGFPESKEFMTVLLDDDEHDHPTHTNIIEAFKKLSEQSMPGDAVFVQFSGHGCRVLDSPTDAESQESYDEVLIPYDYDTKGMIRDTLVFKTLLAPMRYGVCLTCVIDCCDTGMVVDLPYSFTIEEEHLDKPAKLTMNEDFSFVRFLKVVKNLYEASAFTQLGKTVGSALRVSSTEKEDMHITTDFMADEDLSVGGTLVTLGEQGENDDTIFNGLKICGGYKKREAVLSCTFAHKDDDLGLLDDFMRDDFTDDGTFFTEERSRR